jgi:hypothetical protein
MMNVATKSGRPPHCNLRWGGTGDGYFADCVFNPNSLGRMDKEDGLDTGLTSTTGGRGYIEDLKMFKYKRP